MNSLVHKSSKIESGSQFINSTMERHSFCGYDCDIANTEIGSFCSIANGVVIGGGTHPVDWVSTSPVFYKGRDSVRAKFSEHERDMVKKVVIGHDVWIGQNALIKQGVTIGSGAVIGMGSVVTKDVEAYSIVAGCPAKTIKYRFDEELISQLLSSQWWSLEEQDIGLHAKYIKSPETFIEAIKK